MTDRAQEIEKYWVSGGWDVTFPPRSPRDDFRWLLDQLRTVQEERDTLQRRVEELTRKLQDREPTQQEYLMVRLRLEAAEQRVQAVEQERNDLQIYADEKRDLELRLREHIERDKVELRAAQEHVSAIQRLVYDVDPLLTTPLAQKLNAILWNKQQAESALRAQASSANTHRCSGCGHQWEWNYSLMGAELCGDCWRIAQPTVHKRLTGPDETP